MWIYYNFQTTTYHIFQTDTRSHTTLFQLSHNHISHYSNCHTNRLKFIPIVAQSHVTLLQYSQVHLSHYSNCHTITCHIIAIVTRPHCRLFQLSTITYHIIVIRTILYITLHKLPHDIISYYSNIPPYMHPIITINTRTHITLLQSSQHNMTLYFNFHTKINHIHTQIYTLFIFSHNQVSYFQIVTRPNVTFFHLSHENITHYSNFKLTHFTLFQWWHDYMSLYCKFQKTTYHIIPNNIQPRIKLF